MGWWPSKLIVILNLIILLGYSMIDLVVAGQILSAVSSHNSMSVVVGKQHTIAATNMTKAAFRHCGCCDNRLGRDNVRYSDLPHIRTVDLFISRTGGTY